MRPAILGSRLASGLTVRMPRSASSSSTSSFSMCSRAPTTCTSVGISSERARIAVCEVRAPFSITRPAMEMSRRRLRMRMSAGLRSSATRMIELSRMTRETESVGRRRPVRTRCTRSTTCAMSSTRSERYSSSISSKARRRSSSLSESAHSALMRRSRMMSWVSVMSVSSLRIWQCSSMKATASGGASLFAELSSSSPSSRATVLMAPRRRVNSARVWLRSIVKCGTSSSPSPSSCAQPKLTPLQTVVPVSIRLSPASDGACCSGFLFCADCWPGRAASSPPAGAAAQASILTGVSPGSPPEALETDLSVFGVSGVWDWEFFRAAAGMRYSSSPKRD